MSRGELIIDDNQVKESALPATGDWAAEYQQQYNRSPAWADEFVCDESSINLVDAVNLHVTAVMCMYLYTFVHVPLYVSLYTYMYMYVNMYCTYISAHARLHIHTNIYIYNF
jgi:hypothetical protein